MNTVHPTFHLPALDAGRGKKPLTFGDFVAGSYRAWGKRRAEGIIRLVIKSHMVEFRGQQRFVIL